MKIISEVLINNEKSICIIKSQNYKAMKTSKLDVSFIIILLEVAVQHRWEIGSMSGIWLNIIMVVCMVTGMYAMNDIQTPYPGSSLPFPELR